MFTRPRARPSQLRSGATRDYKIPARRRERIQRIRPGDMAQCACLRLTQARTVCASAILQWSEFQDSVYCANNKVAACRTTVKSLNSNLALTQRWQWQADIDALVRRCAGGKWLLIVRSFVMKDCKAVSKSFLFGNMHRPWRNHIEMNYKSAECNTRFQTAGCIMQLREEVKQAISICIVKLPVTCHAVLDLYT